MDRLTRLVATGCFSGYSSLAPGTAGSAVAALIYWLLPEAHQWVWLSVTAFLFLIGVYVSGKAEQTWGEDNRRIVIDEIVGFLAAMLFLPKTRFVMIVGFLLFRLFDIIKPFPAHRSQRLPKGWGVMTDDLIAGIYANVALRVIGSIG